MFDLKLTSRRSSYANRAAKLRKNAAHLVIKGVPKWRGQLLLVVSHT